MAKIILTDEIVADALSKGATITDMLAEKYEGEIADRIKSDERYAKIDAFQHALKDAGISKNSKVNAFYDSSANTSDYLFPAWIEKRIAETVNKHDILQYICSNTTVVPSRSINGTIIDLTESSNKENVKKARVSPGADLPLAKIGTSETATTLYKTGRAIETTYEDIMYQSIDVFGKTLDYIANDVANQEVAIALEVLSKLNSSNVKTWGASDEELTAARMVKFGCEYFDSCGMPATTIIAPLGSYASMALMNMPVTNKEKASPSLAFRMPQGILGNVELIYSSDVPKISSSEQIIALNKDFSLIKYVAQGSQIREIAKNIRNQTQIGTVSEISGFAKFVEKATLRMKQATS